MDRDKERTNVHIVRSKDTGEESALKEKPTREEAPSPGAHVLYAGDDRDWGGQGSTPLPESWVTIHVEGKPVGFMVDTGAQYLLLNRKDGPMSEKTS